ncbi:PilT/PilU family type 4a pilus ATPase [Arenimonas sp.]|nr:PilT/PilU family type 4a pilus ATPase [Candidatus Parcubacteria bacterium]
MNYEQELDKLLETVVTEGASDLHLSEGRYPTIRISRQLIPIVSSTILTHEDIKEFVSLMTGGKKDFDTNSKEIDFSYKFKDKARFRGNAFHQQGSLSIALRFIPKTVRTISDLMLPVELEQFAHKKQGFFLVVGPVGQGKSTTLAAIIESINQERAEHIVTIENPTEYLYEQKKSIIDQREVGIDTESFESGLISALRQDVNVILVGEMRDRETMAAAVTAAETGHLVLSTLHTNNAAQTVDRIIDSFPANQQDQIRIQLSNALAGVLSQRLVPRISGGLIPVFELMITNNAIQNLIREKRTHEINTVIETGSQEGMIDMNRCLAELVQRGEITLEDAYSHSLNPKMLQRLV